MVCFSHDLIGVFSTTVRELSAGPGPHTVYQVRKREGGGGRGGKKGERVGERGEGGREGGRWREGGEIQIERDRGSEGRREGGGGERRDR